MSRQFNASYHFYRAVCWDDAQNKSELVLTVILFKLVVTAILSKLLTTCFITPAEILKSTWKRCMFDSA